MLSSFVCKPSSSLLLILLLVSTSDAVAAPITTSQLASFSLTDTFDAGAATSNVQFSLFDSSLGALTGVELLFGIPYTTDGHGAIIRCCRNRRPHQAVSLS